MEQRRFILFIVFSVLLLILNMGILPLLRGKPAPQPVAEKKEGEQAGDKKDAAAKPEQPGEKAAGDAKKPDGNDKPDVAANPTENAKGAENNAAAAANNDEPELPLERFTLGSADPAATNPYRLLATLTSQGAAVERIELSSEHYRDMEDRVGYLGHLAGEDTPQGVKIGVVGTGTPAAIAGLQVGDIITSISTPTSRDEMPVTDIDSMQSALQHTEPGQSIVVSYLRGGQPAKATVKLDRRPLEVVRPEMLRKGEEIPSTGVGQRTDQHDPYSFLLTLWQTDKDTRLSNDAGVDDELAGVKLRNANWKGTQVDADTVELTRTLPKLGLKLVKRYQIAKMGEDKDKPAYHLTLEIGISNIGDQSKTIQYQLDGPTGLPIEGWWYATRISREWSGTGIRDVAYLLHDKTPALVSPMQTAGGKVVPTAEDVGALMVYAGVDAQYFSSTLMPVPQKDRQPWLRQIKPILVGAMPDDPKYKTLGDVTCRLISTDQKLEPNGPPLKHTYNIFAGPKQPSLLAQYPLGGDPDGSNNLGELIYYGWPIWAMVARPMTQVLQIFYSLVGNYGIAIIMLTILVRGCMFPLSRKQALGAQKMQELKPEMDRINEKYKTKPEEKTRAMQELWRKHNYNPMSGCLVAFLQLPIFIGLYRSLMINVELRQAPLLGKAIGWCSNLAAPDMLARWADWPWMPTMLTNYKGFMSLGPYLNILPIFTVALFIIQQQMFMPPATDEQTQMQQKMMKYMMIFIGYMFYTVPSGLCLYIIASSIWGICEKKLLPKPKPRNGVATATAGAKLLASNDGNGAADRRDRKKQRGGK